MLFGVGHVVGFDFLQDAFLYAIPAQRSAEHAMDYLQSLRVACTKQACRADKNLRDHRMTVAPIAVRNYSKSTPPAPSLRVREVSPKLALLPVNNGIHLAALL